jgi:hypothetical protein
VVTAQIDAANCVKSAPEEIMSLPITTKAVDDMTAYALLTSRARTNCKVSATDFESNGMLRGKRPPRGKGVAIEAFGIRWIPEMCGRTLLTGTNLAKFPYLTRTERPKGSPPVISIGKVTIPQGWVEGTDYHVVAKPNIVNELPCPPAINDHKRGLYLKAMQASKIIIHMDLDLDHKVIVPSLTGEHAIMKFQDVPGFRKHCANPATGGPNMEIEDESLRPENALLHPWRPHDPMAPRVAKEKPKTKEKPKDAQPNTPLTPQEQRTDKTTREHKRQRLDTDSKESIYDVVAEKMGTKRALPCAVWSPDPMMAALFRELTSSTTGTLAGKLDKVSQCAGEINAYCKARNLTQEEAFGLCTTDKDFNKLALNFVNASNDCQAAIDQRARKNWRGAALANYVLANLQYSTIALRTEIRSPAIADIEAFLTRSDRNFAIPLKKDKAASKDGENDDIDDAKEDSPEPPEFR